MHNFVYLAQRRSQEFYCEPNFRGGVPLPPPLAAPVRQRPVLSPPDANKQQAAGASAATMRAVAAITVATCLLLVSCGFKLSSA